MKTRTIRNIWTGARTPKQAQESALALAVAKAERLERELAQAKKAIVGKADVKTGRKAQASAKHTVVKGFAYTGSEPNRTLGSLSPESQAQKRYTLAGYGLAFDPSMTKLEYAQACVAAKASGKKWSWTRSQEGGHAKVKSSGKASRTVRPQVEAQAPAKGRKAEVQAVLGALARLLGA